MTAQKENPLSVDSLAAETEQGADGASGLPAKIARYSEARRKALAMESFSRKAGHVKEADKLRGCADYLLFRHYFTVDKVRLHAASFCKKHLLCPMCAIRRGAKMLRAYLERYQAVMQEHQHHHLKPYLVTLTVKNGEDLGERLRHLRSALKAMSQARRNHSKGQRFVEFARSMGGFHSIEVTNKGQGWHPHVHMVWLCASEPSQTALSREWHDWTGDSYIVDVRPLHDPVEGFLEVCKYALKFSDLEPADNFHAYEVMSGQRLIDAHGLMRGVEIPEDLADECLDDLPYVELFFRYTSGGYSFVPNHRALRDRWGVPLGGTHDAKAEGNGIPSRNDNVLTRGDAMQVEEVFLAPSGQWSWRISNEKGVLIFGAGYPSEQEAREAMEERASVNLDPSDQSDGRD